MSELEDRMLQLRNKADYVLDKDKPVICMIDGRSFSKLVKRKYELPFSDKFIQTMNETAIYTCKEIQGCVGAYVQSDEISFFIDTRPKEDDKITDPFFGFRLCKMNSIIASTATAKYNQLVLCECEYPKEEPLIQFDCKCWNVENDNDVFAWFLFRQLDCIRNSKQQAAQTYLPHKKLLNLHTDEQIELLKSEKGIDWNNYKAGEKYGRFIWKEYEDFHNPDLNVDYTRSVWKAHDGWELSTPEGKEKFLKQYNLWKD